ncbi:MAG: glycine cleavage system protein GcvH [Planctomycetota bacterium]
MSRPDDLKYTATHEWARIEGDVVTVGITDHAIEQLSDLAYVDLPEVGESVEKGGTFGEVESTKTVADLVAPIGGEVIEANSELEENLQLLSTDPFGAGWIAKFRVSGDPDVSGLLDAAGYEDHIKTESH